MQVTETIIQERVIDWDTLIENITLSLIRMNVAVTVQAVHHELILRGYSCELMSYSNDRVSLSI